MKTMTEQKITQKIREGKLDFNSDFFGSGSFKLVEVRWVKNNKVETVRVSE